MALIADSLAATTNPPIPPLQYQRDQLITSIRTLPETILRGAIVLDRDWLCIERALARLARKQRPSHKKEIKDSINFEQYLELSRQLQLSGHAGRRVFTSSDRTAFCAEGTESFHADLTPDAAAVNLEYFTSLRAALGSLGI